LLSFQWHRKIKALVLNIISSFPLKELGLFY
jgi:hypothetical protein